MALLAAPGLVFAQAPERVWRLGFLSNARAPDESVDAFKDQLKTLGYLEGRNLQIEYRWGAGNEVRLAELAADLVRLKVDVIVTRGQQAVVVAKRATSSIPIVIATAADPVGTGIVTSLARPGGNITGLSTVATDLAAKRVQLLRELLPAATKAAVLVLKGGPATPAFVEQIRAAGQQLAVAVVVQEVNDPQALAAAFAAMQNERAQVLIVQASPFTADNAKRIIDLAVQHRLLSIFETRGPVDLGGLLSYGPNLPDMHRRAALYVDRIFKGAKPADLPLEQPTKFEMVINLKTAKALGITIPQSLLLRAEGIGFSNALFLPHGTPNTAEQGRHTAPDVLESVFGRRLNLLASCGALMALPKSASLWLRLRVIPCLRGPSIGP
jgi:putative ABC transport system substrate-binding protein